MIDREPNYIHSHCMPGCAMNKADPENQCGDGCILVTVYGPGSQRLNPRRKIARGVSVFADDPSIKKPIEPVWVQAAREFEKLPWWKRQVILAWDRIRAWATR